MDPVVGIKDSCLALDFVVVILDVVYNIPLADSNPWIQYSPHVQTPLPTR